VTETRFVHIEELDQVTAQLLTDLSDQGDADVEAGLFAEAIAKYKEALGLVPEPKNNWKVTAWLWTAIGEAELFRSEFAAARTALLEAMSTEHGPGNALVHLRLGQAELALGNKGRARDEFMRAYDRGGLAVFEGEDPQIVAIVKAEIEADDS
jgi:tetratricopeptide (TPR) repeat protein